MNDLNTVTQNVFEGSQAIYDAEKLSEDFEQESRRYSRRLTEEEEADSK